MIKLQLAMRVARRGLIIGARFRTLKSNKEAWKLDRDHHLFLGLIDVNSKGVPLQLMRRSARPDRPAWKS
jgi:hypothetical protein